MRRLAGLVIPFFFIAADPIYAHQFNVLDRGTVVIPVDNTNSSAELTNAKVSIVNYPSWAQILGTSVLGPISIPAGTTGQFTVQYKVVTATITAGFNLNYQISTDTGPGIASQYNCSYTLAGSGSENGGCLDSAGGLLSYQPAPDTTPPQSTATFSQQPYVDALGNAYISTATYIFLTATDPSIPWTITSGSPVIYVVLRFSA